MTATYTPAHRSALLIVVLVEGSRITHEIENDGSRGWLRNGLARSGKALGINNVAGVDGVVLIDGKDVYHYTGSEPAEILGLDA